MGAYIDTAYLETVFGTRCISAAGGWADKDRDGDSAKIAANISAAIDAAESEFNSRMRGGRYTIPFSPASGETSHKIHIAALAGAWMFRSWGITDDVLEEKLQNLVDDAEHFFTDVRAGIVKLDADMDQEYPDCPVIVTTDTEDLEWWER